MHYEIHWWESSWGHWTEARGHLHDKAKAIAIAKTNWIKDKVRVVLVTHETVYERDAKAD